VGVVEIADRTWRIESLIGPRNLFQYVLAGAAPELGGVPGGACQLDQCRGQQPRVARRNEHPAVALAEARRVAIPDGRVLLLNWAPAELCEAAGYLMALGRLIPPPPPGTPGPFALSDAEALSALFDDAGLDVMAVEDVECVWRYADEPTAVAGLMCSGPVVGVIQHAGEQAVRTATGSFLEPFRTADGGYRITNVFRYVIGTPRT